MPLASATRVGPYEIVSTLGGGSMGEVYVAKDLRLSRNVALKIINPDSTNDAGRRRRFAQEARSASSLNHPNIVTIHDFGTLDGISYIVSELVEGESLRMLIKRGPIPLRQLLEIGIQIADGLSAAHQAGIVHRDLKPENIMLTPGGRIKILDFGLAKAVLAENGTEDNLAAATFDGIERTEPGLILGTVGYMSPEQARGAEVSFPSDQFSLGVILHEMSTGQQPFRRETPMQTLLAIANLERVPFTPGPVGFRLLVERCLAKEPERRFELTAEIYDRLRKIRDELPDVPARTQKTRTRKALFSQIKIRRQVFLPIVGGLLLFCIGVLSGRLQFRAQPANLAQYHFAPLSSGHEIEAFPALAPNQRLAAYSADIAGVLQIFSRSIGSALETQLTHSVNDCVFPFWTSDSQRVYYISAGDLWSVGVSGGSPEREAQDVAHAAISPNGRTLALIRKDNAGGQDYSLWTATDHAAPLKFSTSPFDRKRFLASSFLAFSPDGRKLGMWTSEWSGTNEFWILPWPTGTPQRVLESISNTPFASAFSWMPDSRQIVYTEQSGISHGDHLWIADTRNGRRRELTAGVAREQSPAVSADGKSIAFASVTWSYSLAQMPLNGAVASPTAQAPLLSTLLSSPFGSGKGGTRMLPYSEYSPVFSPTHHEYAYVTDRDGSPEIWLRSAQGDWERRLATASDFPGATSFLLDIAFSPDGQRIAYRRASKGQEAIWISSVGGEPPVRLVQEPGEAFQRAPTWSPDGNWIAYSSSRNGHYALMKSRVGGLSAPKLIKENVGSRPLWSPNGDLIATVAPTTGLFLVAADGSQVRQAGTGIWRALAWSRDGSRLYGLIESADHRIVLGSVEAASGKEHVESDLGVRPAAFAYATAFGSLPMRGASVSRDGKALITSVLRIQSDLWLLSGFDK